MSVKTTISEHERYRRLRGYSITALAEAIGRSRPFVSRVENGHELPSPGYRRDVASVLGIPELLIFGELATETPERESPASRAQGSLDQLTDVKGYHRPPLAS